MNSKIAIQRIDNALEKQGSSSNANLNQFDKEDALNKALNDWIRRQVHGTNPYREGSEESTMRVDDLQPLLIPERKISVTNGPIFSDTSKLPENYRYYNRLTAIVSKGECKNVRIKSTFVENANTDDLLQDWTFAPSFDFEESFHIMASNKFRIYHNDDFKIEYILLSYYKEPKYISCEKKDFETPWEWKDGVAEVIIDEAIKLLSGNIEAQNAFALAKARVEENN